MTKQSWLSKPVPKLLACSATAMWDKGFRELPTFSKEFKRLFPDWKDFVNPNTTLQTLLNYARQSRSESTNKYAPEIHVKKQPFWPYATRIVEYGIGVNHQNLQIVADAIENGDEVEWLLKGEPKLTATTTSDSNPTPDISEITNDEIAEDLAKVSKSCSSRYRKAFEALAQASPLVSKRDIRSNLVTAMTSYELGCAAHMMMLKDFIEETARDELSYMEWSVSCIPDDLSDMREKIKKEVISCARSGQAKRASKAKIEREEKALAERVSTHRSDEDED